MTRTLIFFFLQLNFLYALEVTCNFEEVYGNGEVQNGIFLLKDKKLRYEYFNKDLFTIIAKNNNFFLVHQNNKNNVHKIDHNTEVLELLINISKEYPNIQDIYNTNDIKIKIEKSSIKFIRRISINSEKTNVSINIMNCIYDSINEKYFKHYDFEIYR